MATEPNLASIAKGIDIIAIEVAKHSVAITALGKQTSDLRKEMNAGFNRVGRLENRIEHVETRLGRVEHEVKAMRGDIADLKARSR
jgi:hypothetical protein